MQNRGKVVKELSKTLQKVIGSYLDDFVKEPTFETVEKDFHAQDKIADVLLLLQISTKTILEKGTKFDGEYARCMSYQDFLKLTNTLTDIVNSRREQINDKKLRMLAKTKWDLCSRKCLLSYVSRQLNWTAISILSASYISSIIVMRSVFELLIRIATRRTGSMNNRIHSIVFLSSKEKSKLKKLWKELCSWAHPYEKWIKKTCPIFIAYKPMYHPKLCKECTNKLEKITDLLLVITVEKFGIDGREIAKKAKEAKVDFSDYTFFTKKRFEPKPSPHES